jgi:hypothetical protein
LLDFDGRFVDAIREIEPDVALNAMRGPGGEVHRDRTRPADDPRGQRISENDATESVAGRGKACRNFL